MKICSKCKIEKSFDEFPKNKNSRDGYHHQCKDCKKVRDLELKKNPLMQLEKQVRISVRLENKLLKRENKRLCIGCKEVFLIEDLVSGEICKECSSTRSKEYIEKNKENIAKRKREYNQKNKEKLKEYNRERYEKNKDKRKEYQIEYYEKNKEKYNKWRRERRLKKKLENQGA